MRDASKHGGAAPSNEASEDETDRLKAALGRASKTLDLFELATRQRGIGLLLGKQGSYSASNDMMSVWVEQFGLAPFLPATEDRWAVEIEDKHFDLQRFTMLGDRELITVVDHSEAKREREAIHQASETAQFNAMHDALTRLANRSYLFEYLQQTIAESKRDVRRFAIHMIDLDGFKQVNDTLGHQAGDDVLIGVAERLRHHCREADFIARLGGDEFCVVQRNVGALDDVTTLADKLVRALNVSPSSKPAPEFGSSSTRVWPATRRSLLPTDQVPADPSRSE